MGRKNQHWTELRDESFNELLLKKTEGLFKPKTAGQERYVKAIENSVITICTGPAGAGKTWLPCAVAAKLFKEGKIERIVLTRPLVECDEEVGFLPGDLMEKVSGSMMPLLDSLEDFFTKAELKACLEDEKIMIIPLAKMRGRTLKNAFVILDEAQNATFRQLKMFLTRLGYNSKMVVNGDFTQSDLPYEGRNSLEQVVDKFSYNCNPSISIVKLGREDIVRHELISWMDDRLSGNEPSPANESFKDNFVSFTCKKCAKLCWHEDEENFVVCCHCDVVYDTSDYSIIDSEDNDYMSYPYNPYKKQKDQNG